ncbi:hypothetical protein KPH14_010852 [Odynerus spinipes]|uniref:Uncharacterized protein n=1 Tax=Odynerus spinipes TaxID=1348599 RepID=A0AAD9RH65_9HYME|nr:hypothetical protein KPH14_010852 [Odynerus spinipes]
MNFILMRWEMSSSKDTSISRNGNNSKENERVVTDSVHERFRTIHVHCDTCNVDIVGNHVEIEKHFNDTHPSTTMCCYCKSKVYKYRHANSANFDSREPQEFIYHKCRNPKK